MPLPSKFFLSRELLSTGETSESLASVKGKRCRFGNHSQKTLTEETCKPVLWRADETSRLQSCLPVQPYILSMPDRRNLHFGLHSGAYISHNPKLSAC